MSALTSLFTSMANKIRSKVGGSDTYTPTEMVSAIDDVYDAGVASATTPITPSNSSPASMTSGTGYKPTTNGYAIESYSDISISQGAWTLLYDGEIYKMGNTAVATLASTIKMLTPSDASPAQIENGGYYNAMNSGYAYKTQVHLLPGRNLSSGCLANARSSTSWTTYSFSSSTAYDPDGASATFLLDTKFAHLNSSGAIVVDRAIPTAYLSGYVLRGVTSSGSAVYGGVRFLKNGTEISGASCNGSSSTASPSFRRVSTSFAVGDVITLQTKVSSTTQAYIQSVFTITWEGIGYPD